MDTLHDLLLEEIRVRIRKNVDTQLNEYKVPVYIATVCSGNLQIP